jgi:hypothetical protein
MLFYGAKVKRLIHIFSFIFFILYINIFYDKKVLPTSFPMIATLRTDYKLIKIDGLTIFFAAAIVVFF